MKQEVQARYTKAKELISKGMATLPAIRKAKIGTATFYKLNKLNKPAKQAKKKPHKLTVIDLPPVQAQPAQAFIVFGSPAVLAQFVRSYQ